MLAHTSDASNWLDIIARRTEMAFPKMHVFEFLLAGSHEEWPKFSHALRRARCVTGRRIRGYRLRYNGIRYITRLSFSPSTFAALCKSRVCSKVWTCGFAIHHTVWVWHAQSHLPPQKTSFHYQTHLLDQPLICKELQTWTGKISACTSPPPEVHTT